MSRVPVAIVGASGYTGSELLRILFSHPAVEVVSVTAKRAAGQRLDQAFPQFRGVSSAVIEAFDADQVAGRAKVAFAALPHGESAPAVAALRQRGVTVLDLSADFRLRDAAAWKEWYASAEHPEHPAPQALAEAVYGLPELHRGRLRELAAQHAAGKAPIVAVPGCYPTASILAVAPLLAAGLVSPDDLVIDAKSGVSGAGRSPGLGTHFSEIAEGIRPYKVAGAHRHTAEIEQELGLVAAQAPGRAGQAAGRALTVLFTPHLVPMARGILSCVYARPLGEGAPARFRDALLAAYRDERFLSVLPPGELPDTSHVRGSNRVHVNAFYDARTRRVLAVSAIDNLVKGASGQAVQCLNLLLGLDETTGLLQVPMFP
jgi:N-acetyl-gamma-glutamyl-phosphate reductase